MTTTSSDREWAILFYVCGHGPGCERLSTFREQVIAAGAVPQVHVAAQVDSATGAQRFVLGDGPGAAPLSESPCGPVNTGAPDALHDFLTWALERCPARRVVLVLAGLGILDGDSVVGHTLDLTHGFAVCDDAGTGDALDLHQLREVLERVFLTPDGPQLAMLGFDMHAMQFVEVAYEFRLVADVTVGHQHDSRGGHSPASKTRSAAHPPHWPYTEVLRRWTDAIGTAPASAGGPLAQLTARDVVDAVTARLARDAVALVGAGTTDVVSALNLRALDPTIQALDTFSAVHTQWLSNATVWDARKNVYKSFEDEIEELPAYDVRRLMESVAETLDRARGTGVARWSARRLSELQPSVLRDTCDALIWARANRADELTARATRSHVALLEQIQAEATAGMTRCLPCVGQQGRDFDQAGHKARLQALFKALAAEFGRIGEPPMLNSSPDAAHAMADAWTRIWKAAQRNLPGMLGAELEHTLQGCAAAEQIAKLARRVTDTLNRPEGPVPEWSPAPPGLVLALSNAASSGSDGDRQCGVSLYRPKQLEQLVDSNYLQLRFSRELHWTAMLTAIDLIQSHPRTLWRVIESQLTAAPVGARHALMRRLSGRGALTGRFEGQLQVLSAPPALYLSIEPVVAPGRRSSEAGSRKSPVVEYRVRLSSLDRSATIVDSHCQVSAAGLRKALTTADTLLSEYWTRTPKALDRLASIGAQLSEDLLQDLLHHLEKIEPAEGRLPHLVLQLPRELMRYPWELLRDGRGWLAERFALGRQVFVEAGLAPRWRPPRSHGAIKALVVVPKLDDAAASVGEREGRDVGELFEDLERRLPGLVECDTRWVGKRVRAAEFRRAVRTGGYDIIHFAGHGHFDTANPDHSSWTFSDGPLYAFELGRTLAAAPVTPWLVASTACETAMEHGPTHADDHEALGMAGAALRQGVTAFIAPLWKIREIDADHASEVFYESLLLKRFSVGESLASVRRSFLRPPQGRLAAPADVNLAWATLVLYGDPTPTILQRLSPGSIDAFPSEAAGTRAADPDDD